MGHRIGGQTEGGRAWISMPIMYTEILYPFSQLITYYLSTYGTGPRRSISGSYIEINKNICIYHFQAEL